MQKTGAVLCCVNAMVLLKNSKKLKRIIPISYDMLLNDHIILKHQNICKIDKHNQIYINMMLSLYDISAWRYFVQILFNYPETSSYMLFTQMFNATTQQWLIIYE